MNEVKKLKSKSYIKRQKEDVNKQTSEYKIE